MLHRLPHRVERAIMAALMLVYFSGGYTLIGFTTGPERARELRTPLDDAIPFIPSSVLIYALLYAAATYPLFTVRCQRLFRRVAVAYAAIMTVSYITFVALPITGAALRPDVTTLDLSRFTHWGLALTYRLDPPYNLFPSLHLSVAAIAALAGYEARRLYGWIGAPVVIAIGISTWTVKQHFLLDSLAAVTLALAAWYFILRPYRALKPEGAISAFSWRGPVMLLALLPLLYLTAYAVFRLDVVNPLGP